MYPVNFPLPLIISFIATALFAVWLFYRATDHSKTTLVIIASWLAIQGLIALSGFYWVTGTKPPRFLLLTLPPLLFIAGMFSTSKGRKFLDGLDIKALTLVHIMRIPVEILLYWLYLCKAVPLAMTFEGHNFDILSGITAPLVYWGFTKKVLNKKVLLGWNIVCLLLLINVVIIAVSSVPSPSRQLAFDQSNIAVLYFPFIWLPCCLVPIVFFAHLAAIRQLLSKTRQ